MIEPTDHLTEHADQSPEYTSVFEGSSEQEVSPVHFEPLGSASFEDQNASLEMLGDVMIRLSVELGRTELTLADVLALKVGSVVELDKLAGEPGDVYVNGTMIGRGEIVVVDERFGIRVFEVVDPRNVQSRP